MRTKTLVSVAAALAAGVLVAQAQVYSVNIVGYVNDETPNGNFSLVQMPLDDGTNTLISVIPNVPNGSIAYVWNGSGYTSSVRQKAGWNPNLGIPTGTGFFIKPNGVNTNTYVGQVGAAPGTSVTNVLTTQVLTLTGALLPYGTTNIATDSTFGLDAAPNGSILYKWNGAGYNSAVRQKAGWNPALSIDVGESFFIKPNGAFSWVQSLPAN